MRYHREFQWYITKRGHGDIGVLVAFSGQVKINGDDPVSEAGLNGFPESELPEQFDTDAYHLLIVAEKYQTGFDQPVLHTMYVDKKLAGLHAVQTLSRLNRTHPDKAADDTFVLDFVNEAADIRAAFAPYDEVAAIDEAPRSTISSQRGRPACSSCPPSWRQNSRGRQAGQRVFSSRLPSVGGLVISKVGACPACGSARRGSFS